MEITANTLSLLEQTNPGAFTINRITPEGMEMVYASPDAATIVGMGQSDFSASSLKDTLNTVVEDDKPLILAAMKESLQNGKDMDLTYRIKHRWKGVVWIHAKGRIIGTMEGFPILYAVFAGSPENELLEEKTSELQAIVDRIPVSTLIYKKQQGHVSIIYTNAYYRSLPFASETQLMSLDETGLLELIHPDDRPLALAFFSSLFGSLRPESVTYRTKAGKDTKYRWYHLNGNPVRQEDGSVLAYVVFTDITAEKEAEAHALKSQQMYRLAAEQSKQIIWEYDRIHKKIIFQMDNAYTRNICEALGMPAVVENVPDSLIPLVDEPFRTSFLALFDKTGEGGSGTSLEYSALIQGQTHWWRVSTSPVLDHDGKELTVYCSAQDITDMKLEQQRYLDFFQSLDKAYPNNLGSFHLNLTKNLCLDGRSPYAFVLKQKESGTVDGYFHEFSKLLNDEKTLAWFQREFTRENLIRNFHTGKTLVSFPYSYRYPDGLRWREALLVMHTNPRTKDIEAVTYAIDTDKQKRGEMILQLMSSEGSDYIGFIDIISKTFAIHSWTWDRTGFAGGQRVPYDTCLESLAGFCVSTEDGGKLREQASLEKLMEALSQEKKYSLLYDFVAETGQTQKKQILFQWANEEKNEILLVQSDITDVWKDEQERLHRSEEMTALQNTVANVPVGIAVITLQENGFSLVVKNDQIRQLFGNAPLDEKQFLRNIHPDDVAQVQTAITRSYVSDKPVILEFRFHQQADALFRWYRLKANVVDRGEGEKLAYCCLSDIMEEKIAEEAKSEAHREELEDYETQLNMMASSNPNFAASYHLNLTKDLCTNIVVQDAAYDALTKLAESGTADGLFEATAQTIPDASIAAQTRATFTCKALLHRFEKGENRVAMEYPCKSVRGGVRWILGSVNMVRNPETDDVEGITYAVDINDKKKNELVTRTITEQEFDYIGILYLSTGEIELIQKKAYITFPAIGQKVSYSERQHVVGQGFSNSQELELYEQITNMGQIKASLESTGVYTASYIRTDTGNKRTCVQLRFGWLDKEHQIVLIVQSDVTATYEHEAKQLEVIQSALMEAEKACSAKSAFVSRISHDIRTPIGAITNILEFAIEDIHDPEKLKNDLRQIQVSNEFLLSLINDVLDISKIDSGKIELHPEPYLYEDFLSSLNNMFKPLCKNKGIRFTVDQQPGVQVIYIDRIRLNQIIMNLISNAVKYTPAGGSVTVTTKGRRRPDGLCDCAFTVSDTGIGMSEEFQKIMFDPFTQEDTNPNRDKSIQGTGLGLSIVKKLVDLMQGTISVQSGLGKGTAITVSLVVQEVPSDSLLVDSKEEHAVGKSFAKLSGTILLAEDNEINAEIAKRILMKLGLSMVRAGNGEQAVEAFSASASDTYSAILMDIQMPVMNGYEATKAIREMHRPDAKTIPIIAMTADAFTAAIEYSKTVGMTDYVTKPIDVASLSAALAKAMHQEQDTDRKQCHAETAMP